MDMPTKTPAETESDTPVQAARRTARAIFEAGVAAADPAVGVERALVGRVFDQPVIVAVGKAARTMAATALRQIPAETVVIVTNPENAKPLAGAEVYAAAHPVPDAAGAQAALRVEDVLAHARGDVLALISGGGSALLPAPVAGVSLSDKQAVNRLLLASGADIVTMNLIRQQLSRLKGGGMLRAAYPARVTTLVLSDVVGDDLRAIASGPTVAPIGTRAEAKAALDALGVWAACPASVRAHLSAPAPDLGPLPEAEVVLTGSNSLSVAAMAGQAGLDARVVESPLEGDVAAAARAVWDAAQPKGVTLYGGETTVKITGTGLGGRNQELALRVACEAEARGITDFVFLSGGTDGRDGPTDAAGGIVDDGTLARLRAKGLDPARVLANNDSYHGLQASGDLLITGATGTNVADLQVLIRG